MRNEREWVVNPDLWDKLLDQHETHEVEFRWVGGRAGHVENERCDHLAMQAARRKNLSANEEYETPSDA